MLFSSPLFLFQFLPLVLLAYYALDRRLSNLVLLFASLIFYAWGEEVMVWVMLLSCLVNWALGWWVDRARSRGRGKGVVALAVAFNLGLLVLFKYADWLWISIGSSLVSLGVLDQPPAMLSSLLGESAFWSEALVDAKGGIRLPIGISFFTFQAFSYVIDVYRRDGALQKNPLNFALYISLFPQLIAGPIVRYKDVDEQITQRVSTWPLFASGVRRFVIGLGKKMLIANPAAEVADVAFGLPTSDLSTQLAWVGILAYSVQIYFDFSGYSDMAIGLGRMLGFQFLENFNYPYIARSVTEFWRRWHISLSTWFRDYLYIPLGGNRGSAARTYFNLVVVFFLCGLWHGAAATFVVWGLYHGAFLVIERAALGRWLAQRPAALRHAYLLLVVVIGWVLFRADTLLLAGEYLAVMFTGGAPEALEPVALHVNSRLAFALLAGVLGSVPWLPAAQAWVGRRLDEGRAGVVVAADVAGFLLLAAVFFAASIELAGSSYNPFIYFRF